MQRGLLNGLGIFHFVCYYYYYFYVFPSFVVSNFRSDPGVLIINRETHAREVGSFRLRRWRERNYFLSTKLQVHSSTTRDTHTPSGSTRRTGPTLSCVITVGALVDGSFESEAVAVYCSGRSRIGRKIMTLLKIELLILCIICFVHFAFRDSTPCRSVAFRVASCGETPSQALFHRGLFFRHTDQSCLKRNCS